MTQSENIDAYKTASFIASVLSAEFRKNPNFLRDNHWCIALSTSHTIALVRKHFTELLPETPLSIVNLADIDGYQSFKTKLSLPSVSAFVEADIDQFAVSIFNALLRKIEAQKNSPQPLKKQSIFHSPFSRANYGNVILWIEKNPTIFSQANKNNIHYIISKNVELLDDVTNSLAPNEKRIFIGMLQEYFNTAVRSNPAKEVSESQSRKTNELKSAQWIVIALVIGTIVFFYFMAQPPSSDGGTSYTYNAALDTAAAAQDSAAQASAAAADAAAVDVATAAVNASTPTDVFSSSNLPMPTSPASTNFCDMSKAPNGISWPQNSGYLRKMPARDLTGLSTLTIDNTQNNSDVFVKLFNHSTRKTSRFFLVKAYQSYKIIDINPGNYSVRSKFINDCSMIESETFQVQQFETYSGTNFSNITMTLYSVVNGNMNSEEIDEATFNEGG